MTTFGATHDLVFGAGNGPTHGNSEDWTENFGSFQKNIIIKPSPVPPSVLEKPVCSWFKEIYEHGCAGGDPVFCGTSSRVAPVSGVAAAVVPTSGVPLFSGVTASNVAPVSGVADSEVAPVSSVVTSGVIPVAGVTALLELSLLLVRLLLL